jgi:hypothetical protein
VLLSTLVTVLRWCFLLARQLCPIGVHWLFGGPVAISNLQTSKATNTSMYLVRGSFDHDELLRIEAVLREHRVELAAVRGHYFQSLDMQCFPKRCFDHREHGYVNAALLVAHSTCLSQPESSDISLTFDRCDLMILKRCLSISPQIEPPSQTELLDATERLPGVLFAGVPGGGKDGPTQHCRLPCFCLRFCRFSSMRMTLPVILLLV